MADQRGSIRDELSELIHDGRHLHFSEGLKTDKQMKERVQRQLAETRVKARKDKKGSKESVTKLSDLLRETDFRADYQRWYSKAIRVVEQLMPSRVDEFRQLYRADKPPKELDYTTYTICDYLHRTVVTRLGEPVFDQAHAALNRFVNQIEILTSAGDMLESLLTDIAGVLQASLVDDELEAARGLLKARYLRSAGVVAGVVLERHLKRLIENHKIAFRKKPQIGALNDGLKEAGIYDVPEWRRIQRLGDLRNLCGHDGGRDPTVDEVDELISGVERVTSTVF
jgi:hypothetical protein